MNLNYNPWKIKVFEFEFKLKNCSFDKCLLTCAKSSTHFIKTKEQSWSRKDLNPTVTWFKRFGERTSFDVAPTNHDRDDVLPRPVHSEGHAGQVDVAGLIAAKLHGGGHFGILVNNLHQDVV